MHRFIHKAIALATAAKSSAAAVSAAATAASKTGHSTTVAARHLAPRVALNGHWLGRLAPLQPQYALAPCPAHVPTRALPSRRHFASETAPDDQQRKLAELAIKLQQSPDFLQAVNELNAALLAKGLQPDELSKPSLKLFSALMDRDVKAKVEAIAVALKKSGITDEEIKNAAALFAGGGLFGPPEQAGEGKNGGRDN